MKLHQNALSFDRFRKDSLLNGKQSSFSHSSVKGTDKQPEAIDKMSTKKILRILTSRSVRRGYR